MDEPVLVSATDGPLPATIEQVEAIRAAGGTSVDFVLTHTDLIEDAELLELVELELRDIAAKNGLTVGTITGGSSGGRSADASGVPYGPPS